MNEVLTKSPESSEPSAKTIKIDGRGVPSSVTFLVDGKHVVSGGDDRKIRCWRVKDGKEVGTPMDTGYGACGIAVSRDGKWIVSATWKSAQVWSAKSRKKVTEIREHTKWVYAVDVSPDSTRIATGSNDKTACVWSLSTGQRLLGPWNYDDSVFAVKFSPDGRFIATATNTFIRIYDGRDGNLVVDVPIQVPFSPNHSIAWSSNNKQIFVVSPNKIICLDASTGATPSQWSIHGNENDCIALASDGAFIATSSESSISFWDAATHKQIGPVVQHTAYVVSMAISANHIVIGGPNSITLCRLCDILPSSYCDTVSTFESRTQFAAQ